MQPVERIQLFGTTIFKRTFKDQISDKLAYMICSGLLQIGDELPSERELASMLNVSRETVRGAIQALAARGMVEISHGARTRVIRHEGSARRDAVRALREINDYNIEAVYEARRVVELAVVHDVAGRISAPALKRLKALLDAQSKLFDDPVRFTISDREFHDTIYKQCTNPLLANFVSDLYAYALDYRRKVMRRPDAVKRSYEDHRAIVASLSARDPEAAVQTIAAHLDNLHKTTLVEMKTRALDGQRRVHRRAGGTGVIRRHSDRETCRRIFPRGSGGIIAVSTAAGRRE
jgi:DNA-binding FadR family transcriptional regulator